MCFFWFFIFLFRGQTFINEIKKDKNIINQLYLVIGVDFSISVIAYFIFSFFFVFKIGIILWLLSVAEPKLDDDHEERK